MANSSRASSISKAPVGRPTGEDAAALAAVLGAARLEGEICRPKLSRL